MQMPKAEVCSWLDGYGSAYDINHIEQNYFSYAIKNFLLMKIS